MAATIHQLWLASRAASLSGQARAQMEAAADARLRAAGFVPDYAVLRSPDFSEPVEGQHGPRVALILSLIHI